MKTPQYYGGILWRYLWVMNTVKPQRESESVYEQRCETCMMYKPRGENYGCCALEVPCDSPYRAIVGSNFVCEEWVPKWGVEV